MAKIAITSAGHKNEYEITSTITVGRHPDNTIQLLAPTVSGKHARISKIGDEIQLEDVGSRNGTSVNGTVLAVNSPMPLRHKDFIQFGETEAFFLTHDDVISEVSESNPLMQSSRSGPPGDLPDMADAALPHQTSPVFNLDVDEEDEEQTITGILEQSGRFGVIESQPKEKLEAIIEITQSLAGQFELNRILPQILESLFRIFKLADRGCILLRDEKSGNLVPRVFKHRREDSDDSIRISRTVLKVVMDQKKGIRSADAATDEQFSGSESIADLQIRSMMCVPMLGLDGEPIGAISIDSLNPMGQFTDEDIDILMAVAGQAALTYENARLAQSFMAKQKQDNEMDIARTIQEALLPEEMPEVEGYEFFASYDSAQAVGGDYYDIFVLPGEKICVSFGDVAGKGVPGALIMSRMSSCVQSTLRHVHEVEEAVLAINSHMCDTSVEGRFVTYILGLIDPESHEIELCNAGHMSPIIRHADGTIGSFDEEDLVGPPIGVMDGYPYEVEKRKLQPGDIVLLVTDGVDEAMNPEGELYTKERIIEFLKTGPASAAELGKLLLADVRRHANGREQNDDITIMAFGPKGK